MQHTGQQERFGKVRDALLSLEGSDSSVAGGKNYEIRVEA
jgi:hypothetical protein